MAGNPAVETEIPVELDDGIEIPRAEVTITPASTDGAEAVEVKDKLFYAATDADTDALVTPTPLGAEVFFQLRSEDSPEDHALDLDLPADAELVAVDGGGARVMKDGETLVDIPPAVAAETPRGTLSTRRTRSLAAA